MSDKKLKLLITAGALVIYCIIFFAVVGTKYYSNNRQDMPTDDPDPVVEEMPTAEPEPEPEPEPTTVPVTVPEELDVEFDVDPAEHVGYQLLDDYNFWPDYEVLPENNDDTLTKVTLAVEEYLTNNGYSIPDVLYVDGYSCLEPNTFSVEVYYEDTVRLLVYYSADTKQVSVSEFLRNEDYDS